jgi:YVTN family beta-propeller protein
MKMLFFLGLALCSICMGQYLEKVIYLPDTIDAVEHGYAIAYIPDNNTVYVAGDDGIVVFSGEDEQKLLELPVAAWQLFYNPVNGRLYAGVNDSIAVIDPIRHRVIGAVRGEVPFEMPQVFAFDSAYNRLYAMVSRSDSIAFVDCERDSLLRTIPSGGNVVSMVLNTVDRKLYCAYHAQGPNGVAVIDVDNGELVATLPGESFSWHNLAYSPIGNKVYVGHTDGMFVVDCDVDSVVRVHELDRHFAWLQYCESRDCVYFVDQQYGAMKIDCQTDSIEELAEVRSNWGFSTMAYCAELDRLYLVDEDHWMHVVDPAAGSVLSSFRVGKSGEFSPLAQNLLSRKLYCVNEYGGTVSVVDTRGDSVIANVLTTREYELEDLCLLPECHRVYAMSARTGGVTVIDGANLSHREAWVAGIEPASLLAAGSRAFCLDEYELVVISPKSDTVVKRVAHPSSIRGIVGVDPAAGRVYLRSLREPRGLLFDIATESVVGTFVYPSGAEYVAVNPVMNRLYLGGESRVVVIDGMSGATLDTLLTGGRVGRMAYCPAGNLLLCSSEPGSLTVFKCKTNEVMCVFSAPMPSGEMLWNPVTNRMYYEGRGDSLVVIDCGLRALAGKVALGPGSGDLLCDTIRNKVYCSRGSDGTVWVVDGKTDSVSTVVDVPGEPTAMVWSTQGSRVFVISSDTAVISVIVDRDGYPKEKRFVHPSMARPTVLRGSLSWRGRTPATLVDVLGREVLALQSGNNDMSGVAPGVYFVRRPMTEDGRPRTAASVRKVLIQR